MMRTPFLQARRVMLAGSLLLGLCTAALAQQAPQLAPASAGPADAKLVEDLVAAYRILADHNLLDGWGHVSVRHDKDPNHYLMARGMSADMVTAKDIVEFDLDSRPVDTHGLPMSALFTSVTFTAKFTSAGPTWSRSCTRTRRR
jgi:hemin uptake protein HemP